MDIFGRHDLQHLVSNRQTPCVSLLMSTPSDGQHHFRVRWQNQVCAASTRLKALGLSPCQAARLLAPACGLVEDGRFWSEADAGLAVFLAPGVYRNFRLPIAFEDAVNVGRCFHVQPLFHALAEDRAAEEWDATDEIEWQAHHDLLGAAQPAYS